MVGRLRYEKQRGSTSRASGGQMRNLQEVMRETNMASTPSSTMLGTTATSHPTRYAGANVAFDTQSASFGMRRS
jgi:hypothetical protein